MRDEQVLLGAGKAGFLLAPRLPWEVLNRSHRDRKDIAMVATTRFTTLFPFPELFSAAAGPALDVWSEDETLVVSVELPGLDPESLELTLERGVLRLKGERAARHENRRILHRERATGAFGRSIRLPYPVASNEVRASFENGILEVRLPRADEDRPKRIDVQAAG